MRWVINGERIRPVCQPKLDLSTGQMAGFKALPRW